LLNIGAALENGAMKARQRQLTGRDSARMRPGSG